MRTLVLFLLFSLAAPCVHAARLAQVEVESAEVRQGPGAGFGVLFTLKRGTWVYSSNFPTEGYFKIRSREGRVGWVPSDAIRQRVGRPLPGVRPLSDHDMDEF